MQSPTGADDVGRAEHIQPGLLQKLRQRRRCNLFGVVIIHIYKYGFDVSSVGSFAPAPAVGKGS